MTATAANAHMRVLTAAKKLSQEIDRLSFGDPVTHVYNPLEYAWRPHQAYLARLNGATTRVVFLGMNPGPWGMAQTGVPFGEIEAVRDWIGIHEPVERPANEHPKRPVEGFNCARSEVSGRRLWGLFRERFISAEAFFADLAVLNVARADRCPRATEHIPEMVDLVSRLLESGHAYEQGGSYYFRISTFPAYGRLAGLEDVELQPGTRLDSDRYEKDNVRDFALWKACKSGEHCWDTELGRGRPGWHIECSAMSMRYLGETLDIHL